MHLVDPSEAHTLEPGRTVRSTCGYHQPRVLEPASAFPYQPGRPPVRLDQPRLLEKPSTSVEELVARMRNKCLVLRLRVRAAPRSAASSGRALHAACFLFCAKACLSQIRTLTAPRPLRLHRPASTSGGRRLP